mmetsp:Transcript_60286/g.118577  ORF Transcript_60286/g.118577 Transcript_60286/m.118577 type:complete len:441 (-) Transcript_60286:85-1407(-)
MQSVQLPTRSPTCQVMARERKNANNGGRTQRRRDAMADSATLEEQCHPRKIFVGGLAHKTTTQNLRDYFARFGTIVDAVVLRWPDGRSRGFGYVTFSEVGTASSVLQESHKVGGRDVDVKRAVPGTNKLFVGGLPQNATAAELRQHFEAFGVVSDAVVMIDPATNRSRGFGFVCFLPGQEGAAAVTSALDEYQNHRIRGKWIEVKSAAPPHKLVAKETPDETTPSTASSECASGAELPGASPTSGCHLQPPPGLVFPSATHVAAERRTQASQRLPKAVRRGDEHAKQRDARATHFGHSLQQAPPFNPAVAVAAAAAELAPFMPWPPADLLLAPPPHFMPVAPASAEADAVSDQHVPEKPQESTDSVFGRAWAPGCFDASSELQRSLEMLLRLQCQAADTPADSAVLPCKDIHTAKESSQPAPAEVCSFEGTAMSLTKVER